MRKIYEITKKGHKQIQNINVFKKSYFAIVINENPEESDHDYPDFMKKTEMFMGNIKIRKLLQLIDVKSRSSTGSSFTNKEFANMSYVFPSKISKFDHENAIKLEYAKL